MTATQAQFDFGKQLKEEGIQRATDHANQVHGDWSEQAYKFFKLFLQHTPRAFKIEQFREWAKDVIPSPPSLRAFGSITVRAKKDGLIKHVGYAQVTNAKAHRANCSLWQRI